MSGFRGILARHVTECLHFSPCRGSAEVRVRSLRSPIGSTVLTIPVCKWIGGFFFPRDRPAFAWIDLHGQAFIAAR